MMRRARDTVFWSAMATEIRQVAENCKGFEEEPCALNTVTDPT